MLKVLAHLDTVFPLRFRVEAEAAAPASGGTGIPARFIETGGAD